MALIDTPARLIASTRQGGIPQIRSVRWSFALMDYTIISQYESAKSA